MKKEDIKKIIREVMAENVMNEYKVELTKKNLTPTEIHTVAMKYVQDSIGNIVGKKHDDRIRAARDLGNLLGTSPTDIKEKSGKPALIVYLLKNKLVSKDEYIQMFKNLKEKHSKVIKYVKNSDPVMRRSGGAKRDAMRDMGLA
jgi:hypothetical protein